MKKLATILVLFYMLGILGAPALAQQDEEPTGAPPATAGQPAETVHTFSFTHLAAPLGAGVVIFGAAWGIGKIGASAVENMARQPEVAGNVQTAMIIAAALIEGATFFALIVCWFG